MEQKRKSNDHVLHGGLIENFRICPVPSGA